MSDLNNFIDLIQPQTKTQPIEIFPLSAEPPTSQLEPKYRTQSRGRPREESNTPEDSYSLDRRGRNIQAAQHCRKRRLAKVEELEAEMELLTREKEAMMLELVWLGARPILGWRVLNKRIKIMF